MSRHTVAVTMPWMRDGEAFLADMVAHLDDADLRGRSALPGWSRAHVVGHLARNAEALGRLAGWARTGVETPMYAHAEQRATEIERSATAPADVLRRELAATAEALDTALRTLDDDTWRAQVRSALGRVIPAAEIPWMRVREVWLHAVDLGAEVHALPGGVVDVLLDDVTEVLSSRAGCPAAVLVPDDRARTWRLGPPDREVVEVRGRAADLAGWLTGRTDGARLHAGTIAVPAAPRWI